VLAQERKREGRGVLTDDDVDARERKRGRRRC
jgi:hypothetical protein